MINHYTGAGTTGLKKRVWMILFICIVFSLLCSFTLNLNAATYFVAANGNDSANGSSGTPWRTIAKAATMVAAGDTVHVGHGNFAENVTIETAGTEGSRITFRGTNDTLTSSFTLNAAYITIDGFNLNGSAAGPFTGVINGNASSHHVWILNNTLTNLQADQYGLRWVQAAKAPSGNASWLVISNNSFYGSSTVDMRAQIITHGGTNLIVNNYFTGGVYGENDFFHVYGDGSIIRSNLVENCFTAPESATEKGSDLWQVFGFRSWALVTFGVGLLPVDGNTLTINSDTRTWRDTVTDASTEIQIAGTYQQCATNLIHHAIANPFANIGQRWGDSGIRVDFYRTSEGANLTASKVGDWCTSVATIHNSAVTAKNLLFEDNVFWNVKRGQLWQLETYENNTSDMTNIVWRNNIFNVDLAGAIGMNGMKLYNNVFYQCSTSAFGHCFTIGSVKGDAYGTEIINNAFVQCGSDASDDEFGWYIPGAGRTNYGVTANFNFVTGAGWTAKLTAPPDANTRWGSYGWEANGINGGNPLFVDAVNRDFRLQAESPLIGTATNLNALFTTDAAGVTRGSTWGIGAFEFVSESAATPIKTKLQKGIQKLKNIIRIRGLMMLDWRSYYNSLEKDEEKLESVK